MKLSIIIPTLNEALNIGKLLEHLTKNGGTELTEILVSDGGSDDSTREIALEFGAKVLPNQPRCRAKQMNAAAKIAQGDVLYFVHADTLPPASFCDDIRKALELGEEIGGYRFRFDSDKRMLKFNSWMTRFNILSFRGGDQSLFVSKDLWDKLGGFDERYVIMEEYDFLRRSRLHSKFYLIPKEVRVSARKYEENSWFRVNFANAVAMFQFQCGFEPEAIKKNYSKLLKNKIIGYRNT